MAIKTLYEIYDHYNFRFPFKKTNPKVQTHHISTSIDGLLNIAYYTFDVSLANIGQSSKQNNKRICVALLENVEGL